VVVIGSGFGGLFTTQSLKGADVDITVIAETTHHLFQPLLYQFATGILSEGEIAPATREILRRQRNARVLLGAVTDINLTEGTVTSTVLDQTRVTAYDSLVVAAGAGQSYFGNDQFARFAPGMKSIDDALELRGRIFGSFEMAELVEDEELRARLLTFVVVGAGPTGVEMAGQIAELAHRTLRREFRGIDPRRARVILLDAAPSVLGSSATIWAPRQWPSWTGSGWRYSWEPRWWEWTGPGSRSRTPRDLAVSSPYARSGPPASLRARSAASSRSSPEPDWTARGESRLRRT